MLQAQQHAEEQDLQGALMTAGGTGSGALLGSLIGTVPHSLGQRKLRKEGITPNKARPGARMAGSLVGALVGGGLGAGTSELVRRESPEARLIAKIQVQGGRLTETDKMQLQEMLASGYDQIATGG